MNARKITTISCVMIAMLSCSCSDAQSDIKILVFKKTSGFRHESITAGVTALKLIGKKHDIIIDTTENAKDFNESNLKNYKAVIFLSTTGDVLNAEQQKQFEKFIQSGGGFLGIHSATDTEYDWPWYGKLVGAYFLNHPADPNVRKGTFKTVDHSHESTALLPETFERTDEFYNFKDVSPDIHVLVTIDENSYEGGTNGENHPMSWYQSYDGGRAFYTAMGHTNESFSEPLFIDHLWGGIQYVLGGNPGR